MATGTPAPKGSSLRDAEEKTRSEARIRALSKAKQDLEARVAELETQLAAGDTTKLTEQLAAAKDEIETKTAAWATEKALISAGITDPEGTAVTAFAYHRLPAEGRPELSAWLGNREGLPRAVQAYLPAPTPDPAAAAAAGAAPAAAAAAPAAGAAPTVSRLPVATPAATPLPPGPKVTQAQVRAVLTSPEYRALKPAEKRTRLDELQAQAKAAAPAV